MGTADWQAQWPLWAAVAAIGAYHGLNPAMGWPLAVANGLWARRDRAVLATAWPIGAGHLASMAVVLVPFTVLTQYVEHAGGIRLAAGALVLSFGVFKLARPRHPRVLARIRPAQLALWSFAMATAHGAGLMLVPLAMGLCAPAAPAAGGVPGVAAAAAAAAAAGGSLAELAARGVSMALAVAAVHTLAMVAAGIAMAWVVYRWLGLRFLARSWFDLDAVWAASLVVAGMAACLGALGR